MIDRFLLPLVPKQNPETRRFISEAEVDLSNWGVVSSNEDRLRFRAFVQLSPLVYPYPQFELFKAVGTLDQWLFFLDDMYDEDPAIGMNVERAREIMERYVTTLENGRGSNPDSFDLLTIALRERFLTHGGEQRFNRLVSAIRDYLFKGSLLAMHDWSQNRTLSPEEYLTQRRFDSGMYTVLIATEIACEFSAPDEILKAPWLDHLRDLCATQAALVNDYCSFQKEVIGHGYPFNRVRVIMDSQGIDLEQANAWVIDEINETMLAFERAASLVPRLGAPFDAGLQRFLDGMRWWMTGNVAFCLCSGRYTHSDSAILELRRRWDFPEILASAPKPLLMDRPRPSQPRPPRLSAPRSWPGKSSANRLPPTIVPSGKD